MLNQKKKYKNEFFHIQNLIKIISNLIYSYFIYISQKTKKQHSGMFDWGKEVVTWMSSCQQMLNKTDCTQFSEKTAHTEPTDTNIKYLSTMWRADNKLNTSSNKTRCQSVQTLKTLTWNWKNDDQDKIHTIICCSSS